MGRAFSSVCMAVCGIVGVLMLLNACLMAPSIFLRVTQAETVWDTVGTLAGYLLGAAIGAAFFTGAILLRRRIKRLDARIEG
jgi:nitrate reductase gamma subunit